MSLVRAKGSEDPAESRLLLALAEELKLPLLHISHQTELYQQQHGIELTNIQASARHALLLLDNYVLVQRLRQQALVLEPVSVSSVLYDVAHALTPLAKQYDCSIQLIIEGKYGPVMSNKPALYSAMTSIGTSFIAASQQPKGKLVLAAHRTNGNIAAGAFSGVNGLGDRVLRQGRALYGRARQPLQSFTAHPAAGIFIADEILALLGSELRTAQHNNQKGLAALLTPSRQLALV